MKTPMRERGADNRANWHQDRIQSARTRRAKAQAAWNWLVAELLRSSEQDVEEVIAEVTDRAYQLNERNRHDDR